jgi:hypothetical protein
MDPYRLKRIARRALTALVVAVAATTAGEARACPNCKEAVTASEGEVSSMAEGYNWSVLFMLTVPFSMLGTGAFMVHRAVKRGYLPEL